MLYNVAQLLKESIGAFRKHSIGGDLTNIDENNPGPVPVEGKVTLTRIERGVLAQGEARVTIVAQCRRCLEAVAAEVAFTFEEEYVPSVDVLTGATLPLTDDDSAELVINDHHILDLREVLRQYIVMEGLTSAICKADCKGLCPQCGQNLNEASCNCYRDIVDPRLEALRGLLHPDTSGA